MRGTTLIRLNQETLVAAVQLYMDAEGLNERSPQNVVAVRHDGARTWVEPEEPLAHVVVVLEAQPAKEPTDG